MRKVLIGLFAIILLIAAIPVALLVTGTVDKSSLRMVLNVMTGLGGSVPEERRALAVYLLAPER